MKKILSFSLGYFKGLKLMTFIYAVSSVLIAGISLAIPYIISQFIDALVASSSSINMSSCIYLIAGLSLMGLLIGFIVNEIYYRVQLAAGQNMAESMLSHVQSLAITSEILKNPSELNYQINNDSNLISMFTLNFFNSLIINLISFIVPMIVILRLSWTIGLGILCLNILYFLGFKLLHKPIQRREEKVAVATMNYFAAEEEQISKTPYLQTHGLQKYFIERFRRAYRESFQAVIPRIRLAYVYDSLDKVLSTIANILLLVVGGHAVLNDHLSIGQFTLCLTYFNIISAATKYFYSIGENIAELSVYVGRSEAILASPRVADGEEILEDINTLSMKGLTFAYPNKEPIFENYELDLYRNNMYLLMGSNGSGKSTLIKLLTGIHRAKEGSRIDISGKNIKDLCLDGLRREKIAICEQEPHLLVDTIAFNLDPGSYLSGQDKASLNEALLEKLEHHPASKVLAFQELLNKLPEGINTRIDAAVQLSGGEKQKIALMRTFLKNADLVFLDEPTSALDMASKERLTEYLKEYKRDRILIISTHDGELLKSADEIIQL
ncbi:MAG: ABC transporter ATP-binding protein [Eubacteriales bacterium]|nr:ABC transporter ATP-binding protein [Eubacteriales bacterium]